MVSTDIGVWLGAILTIFIYSYFITNRQNIAFRIAQTTVVGCALGYIIAIVMAKNVDYLAIGKIAQGNIIYIIPLIIGLMMYGRLVPGYTYLARTPIALIVAVGLGLGARAVFESDVYNQILASSNWLIVGVNPVTAFNSIISLIAVITVIAYFFFTLRPEKVPGIKAIQDTGRLFLMVYFGAKFGATIMTRLTLFLGRAQFLVYDWLGF